MSDLTDAVPGHGENGPGHPFVTSDDDLNAELDADMAEALAADHDAAEDLAERDEHGTAG